MALLLLGCDSSTPPSPRSVYEFDFRSDTAGWVAGLADYPAGREDDVGFVADHRALPDPLGPAPAFYHRGDNISDDLFMYFARRVGGLEPATVYHVSFRLEFASSYGQDCTVGAGSSVFLKAGASTIEPVAAADSLGMVRLNIDKGQQQNGGANAVLLGDVRNGLPGCIGVPYGRASRAGGETIAVRSSNAGDLWLLFGSESAFESVHELFFMRLRVDLGAGD